MTSGSDTDAMIYLKSAHYGLQLSSELVYSFTNRILDGDVVLISDNGNLNAHQVGFYLFYFFWCGCIIGPNNSGWLKPSGPRINNII